jgi:hypothetical protein
MTADTLARAREERFRAWFEGRWWTVRTDATGEREVDGVKITYDKGHFVIDPPGVFQTPLGHRGRKGYVLAETDPVGNVLPGKPAAAFGHQTLTRANDKYACVADLPDKEPQRSA